MAALTTKAPITDAELQRLADTFGLIGNLARLRLLRAIAGGAPNVGSLCVALGQSQPAVSHHLALLRVAGMIEPRRDGKCIYYSLSELGEKLWWLAGKVVS